MNSLEEAFAEPILKALPLIPQAILSFAAGLVVLYLLQSLIIKTLRLAKTPRTLFDILTAFSKVLLWVILIAVIFQSLGLGQVAFALSGSAALFSVALATGANSFVQDIIAGLFLSRDRDFDIGFRIKTDTLEGIITRIDIRKVRIEDDKGRIHVMPNSTLDRSNWVVLSREIGK